MGTGYDGEIGEDAAVYTIDDETVTQDFFYDRLRSPESKEEEANWDYIGAHFVVGEYDDIFFMGVYPNIRVE